MGMKAGDYTQIERPLRAISEYERSKGRVGCHRPLQSSVGTPRGDAGEEEQ